MEIVDRVYQSGLLGGIGLDPSGVKQILRGLDELGIDEKLRFGVSQGWRLVGAIKSAERQLADGTLWHAGQALMAWAVRNAMVVPAGSAIRIDKGVTGAGKIDPLMATFNAIEVMGTNPVGVGGFAGFYATAAAAVAAQA
jgi:phage terminase large subunit-like protein